jgi:hypothetical protein
VLGRRAVGAGEDDGARAGERLRGGSASPGAMTLGWIDGMSPIA